MLQWHSKFLGRLASIEGTEQKSTSRCQCKICAQDSGMHQFLRSISWVEARISAIWNSTVTGAAPKLYLGLASYLIHFLNVEHVGIALYSRLWTALPANCGLAFPRVLKIGQPVGYRHSMYPAHRDWNLHYQKPNIDGWLQLYCTLLKLECRACWVYSLGISLISVAGPSLCVTLKTYISKHHLRFAALWINRPPSKVWHHLGRRSQKPNGICIALTCITTLWN